MDLYNLLTIIFQTGSFFAGFAAITSAIIMHAVYKKFGKGILATGFKLISIGIMLIAIGIIIDSVSVYIPLTTNILITSILILKQILYVIGTVIVVIGAKKTADKLESLTQ